MRELSFAIATEKKVAKDYDILDIQNDEYYAHPTFRVGNLADYIQLIAAISSISGDYIGWDTVIYRGMVDQEYNLLPGLARYNKLQEDGEYKLINDFLTRRPDAFQGLTEFDTLAKMQHYGLPTRLLDFSTNPLVALYFACESKYQKNGRVLCHGTYLQNDSSAYVNAICTAAIKKPLEGNIAVEDFLCDERLPLKKYLQECYLYDTTTIVRPKYWNQRIANQAGVFMVFPNNLSDRYMYIIKHSRELGIDLAINEYGHGKVDSSRIKNAIDREPISYNQEGNSIVSDDYFRSVYASYRDNTSSESIWEIFNNRFQMTSQLKALSAQKIHDSFCSIIIEAKNKKKIIQELAYIGICTDFIYPELEYTAKEIRRRYE